jgi:hypothetical protein
MVWIDNFDQFEMDEKQSSQISRLIKEAINEGKTKPKDTESPQKFVVYLPCWE